MEGFASSLYQNLMEKSMKRNGKAFAYLFLAVWSMTSIGCTSSSKEERAVREIPVKTWTVSFREGVYTRSYIGEIEGESSSSLSFQVPGYVECICKRRSTGRARRAVGSIGRDYVTKHL